MSITLMAANERWRWSCIFFIHKASLKYFRIPEVAGHHQPYAADENIVARVTGFAGW
ncbi:MAG: hypothetical protein RG741_06165 [Bacteroidales bacterium]|nr:hypothetical protein [Bacteroidales bacterium]